MLPKWLFWRSRLRGIWHLLTMKYFVVMTSNQDGDKLRGQYNVNHPSFLLLMRKIGPAIQDSEGQAEALQAAKEILNQHD